jgi:hypothetical protein
LNHYNQLVRKGLVSGEDMPGLIAQQRFGVILLDFDLEGEKSDYYVNFYLTPAMPMPSESTIAWRTMEMPSPERCWNTRSITSVPNRTHLTGRRLASEHDRQVRSMPEPTSNPQENYFIPEKSRAEQAIGALVFVLSAIYLWPYRHVTDLFQDEGIVLQGAQRILEGQVLYRDFFSFTPRIVLWAGAAFQIFRKLVPGWPECWFFTAACFHC